MKSTYSVTMLESEIRKLEKILPGLKSEQENVDMVSSKSKDSYKSLENYYDDFEVRSRLFFKPMHVSHYFSKSFYQKYFTTSLIYDGFPVQEEILALTISYISLLHNQLVGRVRTHGETYFRYLVANIQTQYQI